MKLLPLLALVVAAAGASAEERTIRKTVEFRHVDSHSAEFKHLYEAALQQCAKEHKRRVEITQHAEDSLYLGFLGQSLVAVDLPPTAKATRGEKVEYFLVEDGTYSYISVLGAKETVKRYIASSTSLVFGDGQFLARLKQGEQFEIRDGFQEESCKACGGWGRVPDKSKRTRKQDGKVPCAKCKNGVARVPVVKTLKW